MKILIGAGNYTGSNLMVSRWVKHLQRHDIKIAAWYKNHKYLNVIDWCFDGMKNYKFGESNYFKKNFGIKGIYINSKLAEMIIDELFDWKPDLIISDCDKFTAAIAKIFEIPLWYCSSMLQFNGIDHCRNEMGKNFDIIRSKLEKLPKGDKYLVYSSLCDISLRPFLKDGFEWVMPYFEQPIKHMSTEDIDLSIIQKLIPDNSLLCTGETSFVSDCIYDGKMIFINPNPKDFEQFLNAQLLEWYGCAKNIGRSQNVDFIKTIIRGYCQKPVLSIQGWKTLDERLDDYEKSCI